jgi:hypothetical protein
MKRLIKQLLPLACCLFAFNTGFEAAYAQTTAEIARGNCKSCIESCEKSLTYCTNKGGKFAEAGVTNAIKDCLNACRSADDVLNRGSNYLESKSTSMAVDAATNLAKVCDKFPGDPQMTSLANECRKTIGNCSKISSGTNSSVAK